MAPGWIKSDRYDVFIWFPGEFWVWGPKKRGVEAAQEVVKVSAVTGGRAVEGIRL